MLNFNDVEIGDVLRVKGNIEKIKEEAGVYVTIEMIKLAGQLITVEDIIGGDVFSLNYYWSADLFDEVVYKEDKMNKFKNLAKEIGMEFGKEYNLFWKESGDKLFFSPYRIEVDGLVDRDNDLRKALGEDLFEGKLEFEQVKTEFEEFSEENGMELGKGYNLFWKDSGNKLCFSPYRLELNGLFDGDDDFREMLSECLLEGQLKFEQVNTKFEEFAEENGIELGKEYDVHFDYGGRITIGGNPHTLTKDGLFDTNGKPREYFHNHLLEGKLDFRETETKFEKFAKENGLELNKQYEMCINNTGTKAPFNPYTITKDDLLDCDGDSNAIYNEEMLAGRFYFKEIESEEDKNIRKFKRVIRDYISDRVAVITSNSQGEMLMKSLKGAGLVNQMASSCGLNSGKPVIYVFHDNKPDGFLVSQLEYFAEFDVEEQNDVIMFKEFESELGFKLEEML